MIKILLLEDDSKTRLVLAKIIREIDEKVLILQAEKIKDAISLTKENDIDIFLLDIQLGDGLGTDFALKIRESHKYKMTPIVFITAVPTREMIAFKSIHCYDYIIKPFNIEKVRETLKLLLNYGVQRQKKRVLKINQKNFIYSVDVDEIIYFEAKLKKIEFTTINGIQQISSYTIKKLLEVLPKNFIQCHRSYVVNMDYLKKVNKVDSLIELNVTNQLVPLGEKYITNLIGEFK